MKTIINSSKRTHWFKVLFALLTGLLFLLSPSCQKNQLYRDSMLDKDIMSVSALSGSSSASFVSMYYGPETFTIFSDRTVEATRTINNMYFGNFGNSFVLKVQNGSSNDAKVSKIEVKINGKLIIKSSEFKKVNSVEKKLNCFTNPAQLDIKIVGSVGSSIELWIEGTVKLGKIKDVQGNTYKTVKIGNQWWMAENLKSTKYNDGRTISNVIDNTDWINLSAEAYCWYNNDISNKATYGALYNWFTVRNGNLCPAGWHVPSDMEWLTLIDFLGGESIAGAELKEIGNTHWISPNTGATDESGFTALPSGDRIGADGSFYNLGGYAIYWSSDEATFTLAINRVLVFDDTNFRIGYDNKTAGFSVRCIKDN